jgi:hypothetical protein
VNRRGFLGRLFKAAAGAALATHVCLGDLVPVAAPVVEEMDYFVSDYLTSPSAWFLLKPTHLVMPPELVPLAKEVLGELA